MDEEAEVEVQRRRPVKRLIALGLFGLLLLALFVLWTQRLPIASDYVADELEKRGVRATYDVTRVGFGRSRLENVVIGDPKNPDLTARSVEVELDWSFSGPEISLIRARGVRLKGRLEGDKLSFGEVDKLLPPPSGAPFRFPDQVIDVADAAIRLDTRHGRIGIGVEGKGNLADGFRGELAATSAGLDLGDCRIDRPRGHWQVAIDDLKPTLEGPLEAARLACGDAFAVEAPRAEARATLSQALDAWDGRGNLRAAGLRAGDNALGGLAGRVSFKGDDARTVGSLSLAAARGRFGGMTAGRTAIDGGYTLSMETGAATLAGDVSARGVDARSAAAPVADALAAMGGTPLEPIGEALAAGIRRAASSFDARGAFRLVNRAEGGGGVRFERLSAQARSGARLALSGGEGLNLYWPGGRMRLDGDLALSGGGLPPVRLSLDQARPGAPIRGEARVSAMRAGNARLALAPIRFTAAPGGATRIESVATIDGPIEDGRVEGLVLPLTGRIDGRGGFVVGEKCVRARFALFRIAGLTLRNGALPLCPRGRAMIWKEPGGEVQGGFRISPVRLFGRLGGSPISLAAGQVTLGLERMRLSASDLEVRLGPEGAAHRLEVERLEGDLAGSGVGGTYAGLSGKLSAVPLLLSEGAGAWRVRDGDVFLDGRLRVADEMEPPRFYPLVSDDFRLSLIDNRIEAGGWLDDPETGTRILRAEIDHDLRTGFGRAGLDVPGIVFDENYQPEELTRLTTGVVALVDATLRGQGEIVWDARGTTSTGTFSTEGADFAAAFGPVEDFSSTVRFTDLLGLVSAPGQEAQVGLIRTGIDVFDGRIRYQLLPGQRVRVESGRWPFAGGELFLEETVLDFSRPSVKRLTFRVVGMDAAIFVQQMEFSNISATGTFDGVIPMVFDEGGGRIEGGRLVARAPGGTLSYIGELTDRELGVYGKLAFDALKALRYSKLTIGLDGSLDGEFVAAIELDGVARDPALTTVGGGGIKGMIARRALGQLAKIPFEFNISVKGPFRSLIATMRSFEDPTNLIQSVLPEKLMQQADTPPVQAQESENVP